MKLQEVMDQIEADYVQREYEPYEVLKAAKGALSDQGDEAEAEEASLLAMVFVLETNPPDAVASGECRFVPPFSVGNRAYPVMESLSADQWQVICRWAGMTQNPRMKARYGDVVWTYTQEVAWARTAIEGLSEVARLCLDQMACGGSEGHGQWELADVGPRLLQLACSIDDEPLLTKGVCLLREACSTSISIAKVEHLPHMLRLVVRNKRLRRAFGEVELRRVLEDAARIACETEREPVHTCKEITDLLVRLAGGDRTATDNALGLIARLYEEHADSEAARSNMIAALWFQKAARVLQQMGASKNEVDRVMLKLEKANAASVGEMKPIISEISISRDSIDEYVAGVKAATRDVGMAVLGCEDILPSPGKVRQQVAPEGERPPIFALFSSTVTDGIRTLLSTSATEKNIEQFATQVLKQQYQIMPLLAAQAAVEVVTQEQGGVPEAVADLLRAAGWVSDFHIAVVEAGLERYVQHDYVSATHLLLFQIEGLVRDLGKLVGVSTTRLHRDGTQYRPLGDLLSDPCICEALGDDLSKNMRVILTDSVGLNMRNEVAHGVPSLEWYTESAVLLLLVLVCQIGKTQAGQEADGSSEQGGPVVGP